MPRSDLYQAIEPFSNGYLDVDPVHQIYWEQCGNPDGVPILFLHGGPGAGASAGHRRFFDPRHYRIVLIDQRGSGRSRPFAEVRNNTTAALVNDIEAVRQKLKIEKWVVFGGSWGSSLGLAYAEKHADRCFGLILRGIFLCTQAEVNWFMTGMGRFFPNAYQEFIGFLPEPERSEPLDNYYRRLCNQDPEIHLAAAAAWSRYEAVCSTLLPNPETVDQLSDPNSSLALARLEAHYFINGLFLEDDQLIRDINAIADLPGYIIQGRYDVVCPPCSADRLAAAWPKASYSIIPDAGHSATEPGITRALVEAAERFKSLTGR